MHQHSTNSRVLRKRLVEEDGQDARDAAASGVQEPLAQPGGAQFHSGPIAPRVHSVITLAPDTLGTYLNEQGQAAFSSLIRSMNSYVDGDRLPDFASLDLTLIRGQAHGAVVTWSDHCRSPQTPLRAAGGAVRFRTTPTAGTAQRMRTGRGVQTCQSRPPPGCTCSPCC